MTTFTNKDGKEIQRQKCQVYTRVMGYLRPVSHYNVGKKSEFYSRTYFTEEQSNNSKFMKEFGTTIEVNANYNLLEGYNKVAAACNC